MFTLNEHINFKRGTVDALLLAFYSLLTATLFGLCKQSLPNKGSNNVGPPVNTQLVIADRTDEDGYHHF